jgi:peptidoglycan/LPS O-acetylase OafA/YrhL
MKNPSQHPQRGAALLMMMLALIAISSALSYQYFGNLNQKLKRQNVQEVVAVLEEVKENLLVFSSSQT